MINVFIAENIPSLNKGEMAIYGGMCELLKVIGMTEVHMLSIFPEIDMIRYENKAKIVDIGKSLHFPNKINSTYLRLSVSIWAFIQHLFFLVLYKIFGLQALRVMKSEIWKTYTNSDLIIIGHNGTFGIGGNFAVPLHFMLFYIPLFAKVLGKPVAVYGGSIGLSKNFLIKALVRYVLNRIDLITLREGISYENLKNMGVKNHNVYVLPDPALLLPSASSERADEILLAEGISNDSRPLIGITVTHEIASKSSPNLGDAQKQYQRHIKLMAEVIDNLLIEQIQAKIIFLPHCIEFYHNRDDRVVSKDIYDLCKNKANVKVITNEYTAEELKAIMAKCDLFIGERIHSVIGAMSMGVPALALGLSNDQRLTGIIEGVFKEENLTCKLETIDADLLFKKIMKVWQKREEIGKRLKLKMETLKREAMINGELLKKVIESKKNKS